MTKLSGKIALVTGGTGALGSSVALALLQEGAVVIVTHTGSKPSDARLNELRSLNSAIEDRNVDVTEEDSIVPVIQEIMLKHGTIDILCHCVGGISEKRSIEEITLTEWNKMMILNLQSSFLMMKHVLPSMKKRGFGRIINIAAMAGVTPEAERGGYGVSKAAVIALTKTAAEEVKLSGDLTVNAIAPSIITTEANKQWGTEEEIKQWVTPEQIAAMIVHLCSVEGAAINGQIIQMYGKV